MRVMADLAEEFGITQANVAQMANDPRPEVQRMLGRSGELGKATAALSERIAAGVLEGARAAWLGWKASSSITARTRSRFSALTYC